MPGPAPPVQAFLFDLFLKRLLSVSGLKIAFGGDLTGFPDPTQATLEHLATRNGLGSAGSTLR